jgi:hypothetical protein
MLKKGKIYRVINYGRGEYAVRAVATAGFLWVCEEAHADEDFLHGFKSVATGETAAFYADELEAVDAGEG